MSRTLASYQEEFERHFENAYKANDPAHQVDHFRDVYTTGLYINSKLDLNYDPLAIMTVAYIHDLFAWSRDNHHILSYTYMLTTEDPLIAEVLATLKAREEHGYYPCTNDLPHRTMIAQACREHRASYKDEFSHTFSELMNSADRGAPQGLKPIMDRAYQYALAHNKNKTPSECMDIAIAHVKDKFSRTGYARIPDMYKLVYGDELNTIWNEIDDLE